MKRSLFGDLLVRYLIVQRLGITNDKLIFSANQYGKPYIENYLNIHYNVSHSGSFVLCGISSEEIGVDIEKIGQADIAIAKRFFTNEEYLRIMEEKSSDINKVFYTYWTLKESYIKYIGKGLSMPLDSFSFINRGNEYILKDDEEKLNFFIQPFEKDYMVAITYKESLIHTNIKRLYIKDVLYKLNKI